MMQRGLYIALGAVAGYALFGTFAALGFAAVAVNLLTPFPAAYVGMRCGSAAAAMTVILTALLIMLTGSQATMLMYVVQFGLPGAVLPWLLNRGLAWDKATVFVLWVMVAVTLVGLLGVSAVAGRSPLAMAGDLIGQEITQTRTAMEQMFAGADMTVAQREDVSQMIENMAVFLEKAYPGIAITIAGVMILGMVFLLSVFGRGRYTVPGRPFPAWKAPEQLVWVLIVSGFTVAFAGGIAATFALNLLVILLPVYFLQGLAVIDCFFRRKAFSPIFRAIGYVLVTLVNPLPLLVTGLGVFDLWADFRKPRTPKS